MEEQDKNTELLRNSGGGEVLLGTECCTGQTFLLSNYGVIKCFNHLVYSAMRYNFQVFIT
jgi:hypothetical protein